MSSLGTTSELGPLTGGQPPSGPGTPRADASAMGLLKDRVASILHLITGNFGVALVMLGSLSLAGRALGPEAFGTLAIVLSIGRVSERLVRFESWQPLVRFVASEEASGNRRDLSRIYAYGLLLDVTSALVAALIACTAGLVVGQHVGLSAGQFHLVAIYACAIACNIRGMPSAALRMGGRFRTLAYVAGISAIARLLLAALLFINGAGLVAFVVLWTSAQILDSMIFITAGFRSLRDQGIPNPLFASWRGLPARFPGFLKFAFSTNLSSTLRTLTHEMDTLLVGLFAGPRAAGLYFLARRIAKVAQQAGDLIQTVVYPDLARLWANADRAMAGRMVMIVQCVLAGLALAAFVAVWLLGMPVIRLTFGQAFTGAYPLLLAQVVAVALILHAAPSRSALLAMNKPTFVLAVAAVSTVTYFAAALVLLPRIGAIGANIAHIAFGLTTAICLDAAMWKAVARHGKAQSR